MLEIILKRYSAPSLDVNPLQKECGLFRCTKFSDIYTIIIPFCNHDLYEVIRLRITQIG